MASSNFYWYEYIYCSFSYFNAYRNNAFNVDRWANNSKRYRKEVGGYLAIAQNGNKNKVALDFATTGSGRITQTGNSNTVGRFSFGAHFTYTTGRPPHTETVLFDGLCENCPTDFADFKGDNLNIIQQGNNNKISLESTTANANVTISQFGNNNKARVYQGLAGNYTASIYIPCSGCQH